MKIRTLITLAMAALALSGLSRAEDFGKFASDVFGAMETEKKKLWKEINWERDPAKAMEKARASVKPLLVFLHVKGQFNFDSSEDAC